MFFLTKIRREKVSGSPDMQSGTCKRTPLKGVLLPHLARGALAPLAGSQAALVPSPALASLRVMGDAGPQPAVPFLRKMGRGEKTERSFSLLHLLFPRIFL